MKILEKKEKERERKRERERGADTTQHHKSRAAVPEVAEIRFKGEEASLLHGGTAAVHGGGSEELDHYISVLRPKLSDA